MIIIDLIGRDGLDVIAWFNAATTAASHRLRFLDIMTEVDLKAGRPIAPVRIAEMRAARAELDSAYRHLMIEIGARDGQVVELGSVQ